MTIFASDIKIVASKVMDDTDNGGGPPSPTVVNDGVKNAIFPDLSELDWAQGSRKLRKVFASVQSPNADTLLGSNVIISEPPSDPLMSVAMVSCGVFDTHADIESAVLSGVLQPGAALGACFIASPEFESTTAYPWNPQNFAQGAYVVYVAVPGSLSSVPASLAQGKTVYPRYTSTSSPTDPFVIVNAEVIDTPQVMFRYTGGGSLDSTAAALTVTRIKLTLSKPLVSVVAGYYYSSESGIQAIPGLYGSQLVMRTGGSYDPLIANGHVPAAPGSGVAAENKFWAVKRWNGTAYGDFELNPNYAFALASVSQAAVAGYEVHGASKLASAPSAGATSISVESVYTRLSPTAAAEVQQFAEGRPVVIGHTAKLSPATVSNGQTLNAGRTNLARVRVIGNDGLVITAGYTADLAAGTVTFTNVTGYSQPVTFEHRIEDMRVVTSVNASTGVIGLLSPLSRAFPLGSVCSSALVGGDIKARITSFFDQATWNGTTWQDTVSGSAATGTFNDTTYPIALTNAGATTERWALQFTGPTAFNVIGERVGQIGTGTTGADCAPINPATGVPYFTIPAAGWGAGWAAGNVLRINTEGALIPVALLEIVRPGVPTVSNDSFTLLARGDINA